MTNILGWTLFLESLQKFNSSQLWASIAFQALRSNNELTSIIHSDSRALLLFISNKSFNQLFLHRKFNLKMLLIIYRHSCIATVNIITDLLKYRIKNKSDMCSELDWKFSESIQIMKRSSLLKFSKEFIFFQVTTFCCSPSWEFNFISVEKFELENLHMWCS